MALTLTYDPVLSRVRISGTGLIDQMTVRVERSTNQVTWATVRGGTTLVPVGGAISLDDYEFSADVPNYYRLRGPVAFDDYQRSASNGWGTLKSGQVTTTSGGALSDYLVNGAKAVHSHTSVGVFRHTFANVGATDMRVRTTTNLEIGAVTGADISTWTLARALDTNNYYAAHLAFQPNDDVVLRLGKRVAGTLTLFAGSVIVSAGFGAGTQFTVDIDATGSTIKARAWAPATEAEPDENTWDLTTTDTSLTTGTQFGHAGRLEGGNTNTLPVEIRWDNTVVSVPEATIFTANTTPTLDGVWLKSLARPFLNRKVTVVDYSDVERASRGGVFPIVGRSFPVAVTDLHGSRQWTLDVLAETAQEAEDLDLLISTGEVQFVHVPADERVPGGYVALGNTTERRPGRRSIRRVFSMPLTEVAAPGPDVIPAVGTWQSVLNSYATWADVLAAHPTWESLLQLVGSPADVVVP